jgi:hypothetical protein
MSTTLAKNKRRFALAWLVVNEIKQKDIQKELGHKSINQVHATLHGFRNDRNVLRKLLEMGCPASDLDLPDDMRVAA